MMLASLRLYSPVARMLGVVFRREFSFAKFLAVVLFLVRSRMHSAGARRGRRQSKSAQAIQNIEEVFQFCQFNAIRLLIISAWTTFRWPSLAERGS